MELYICYNKAKKAKESGKRNASSITRTLNHFRIGIGPKCFDCEYYSPECVKRGIAEGVRAWDESERFSGPQIGDQICWCCAKYCSCTMSRGEPPKGAKWHATNKSQKFIGVHIDSCPHFKRG